MSDEATAAVSGDSTAGPDKDFLELVIKAIVAHPDDVVVERSVDDLGVLLKLRVNEEDMSKIVGKEGRTAKALRTLLRLVGSKFDQRVNLKILEPDGSERRIERSDAPASEKRDKPVRTHRREASAKKPVAAEKPAEGLSSEASAQEGEDAAGAFENVI